MKQTSLYQTHVSQSGKMIEFAGYEMPVQYSLGMLKEHEWVREGNVGLFDVSHMGQILLEGKGVAEFLSYITPSSFLKTKEYGAKYTVLTNENGGIIDDLIITKINQEKFFVVINAACKDKDIAWMKKHLPKDVKLTELNNRSLIAVQGTKAEKLLAEYITPEVNEIAYMTLFETKTKTGAEIFISRTGYTGEDGFEISIKDDDAKKLWNDLCQNDFVKPIGLGARDTLRLEVGYPLYGHDLDDTTTPIEAGLGWVVSKLNENYIGRDAILEHKENGVKRKRWGVKLIDKGIAREGSKVIDLEGRELGILTSGGFSPKLKNSIGQAYIDITKASIGDEVKVVVRNRELKAVLCSSVFIKASTKSLPTKNHKK